MFTYIMESHGLYKIGKAIDVTKRFKSLRTGNLRLKIIKVIEGDYECFLHNHFKSKCVELEWFELSEEDVILIDELISNKPENPYKVKRQQNNKAQAEKIYRHAMMTLLRLGFRNPEILSVTPETYNFEIWCDDILVQDSKLDTTNDSYVVIKVTSEQFNEICEMNPYLKEQVEENDKKSIKEIGQHVKDTSVTLFSTFPVFK